MSFTSLYTTIATLALLLLVGYVAGKTKIIDEVSTHRLSEMIVKIGQPFLIINSLISLEYTPENAKTGFSVLLLGLCMHAGMALVAFLCSRGIKDFNEKKISEFAMFLANCGFVGFPIIESLYGKEGLFYGAFYLVSFHLFVWTWGVIILARGRADIKITPKKIILNFGTLPCLIGMVIFLSRLPLPEPVRMLSSYLNDICTPVSIMISGANLARRSFKKMLSNPGVYRTCGVKLLLQPILVTVALWLIGLPDYMVMFGAVMAAMPCPAVVTMFGETYKITPGYAAELVGSSTVFSAVTIIPVVLFAQFLIGLR